MEVPYNHFWWCGYYQGPWVSFVTTDEFSTRVLKITLGQKRSTFVSRNWLCEKFFITHLHNQMCIRIHIFVKKTKTYTQTKSKKTVRRIKEKSNRNQRRKLERKCFCCEQYLWKIKWVISVEFAVRLFSTSEFICTNWDFFLFEQLKVRLFVFQ